jgi:haloalkane dehalogenase
MCTFPKAVEMCRWVRAAAPEARIVLGGYGTVLPECERYADHVCREEGVGFFRRLLGEPPLEQFTVPSITRTLKVMSVTTRPEAILPTGLGCSRGCDFCCTSHFFDRRTVPLVKTGEQIHRAMVAVDLDGSPVRTIGVIDEDFLANRRRIEPMIRLNAEVVDRPILFSCLTSLKSLTQYTTDELLSMGLAGVWVGIESKRADYPKLRNVDPPAQIAELQRVGIVTLTSIIIGYDWHDEQTVEEDFQYLLSLNPTFSQAMIYSPCPQTPLYQRFLAEDRLLDVPLKYHDGFHALFKHPHLSAQRLEQLVLELFRREYEALGPSVCRVLDLQLRGYQALRHSPHPLFRRRAEACRELALQIYPLVPLAIRRAPSERVRQFLTGLKQRVEEAFVIPARTRFKTRAAPLVAAYATWLDRFIPVRQPRSVIRRFRVREQPV